MGNRALRLKCLLEAEEKEEGGATDDSAASTGDSQRDEQQVHSEEDEVQDVMTASVISLAERILELQIKEPEMDLA